MRSIVHCGMVVLVVWLVSGCSKPSAADIAAGHRELFPAGQLKTDLDSVVADLRTNGFVSAEVTLVKMERENPTAQQLIAIHDTMATLKEQIRAAAASGDINASNQLKALIRTNIMLY